MAATEIAISEKDTSDNLIKEIAMDIGKEVVTHIDIMYPAMFEAVAGTAKLSVRNCVYNEILAAIQITGEGEIKARLDRRKKFRRQQKAALNKIRGECNHENS